MAMRTATEVQAPASELLGADELVGRLVALAFSAPIELAAVAEARSLRDSCRARGIKSAIANDGAVLVTVDEAWNWIVASFVSGNEWTALTRD